jgi:hypothetical protein
MLFRFITVLAINSSILKSLHIDQSKAPGFIFCRAKNEAPYLINMKKILRRFNQYHLSY